MGVRNNYTKVYIVLSNLKSSPAATIKKQLQHRAAMETAAYISVFHYNDKSFFHIRDEVGAGTCL